MDQDSNRPATGSGDSPDSPPRHHGTASRDRHPPHPHTTPHDSPEETGRWIGRPLPRREDPALLTGRVPYLADLDRPGTARVRFVRSTVAHARVTGIETDTARAMPGIIGVFTADDLATVSPAGSLAPQRSTHELGTRPTPYFALARNRVRHVGEAIVAVVGETAAACADAAEAVVIEYSELPVVIDVEAALSPESPVVHEGWPDNVAGVFEVSMGDPEQARMAAAHSVTETFRIQRQTAASLEPRGVLAIPDPYEDRLTVWTSTQSPNIVRDFLAEATGIPQNRLTVRVPAVGGGFGAKFHHYPEETAVALLAVLIGRPVMWVEDRTESFTATVHAREQVVRATMTADEEGRITAVIADISSDQGAYMHMASYGPAWLTSVMMTNVYAVPNAAVRLSAVVTNKTPSGSYRGWGQPQANFVVERLVELLAAEMGVDSLELRRRNFVPPDRFPYTGLFHTFDSGRYEECLDLTLERARHRHWLEIRDAQTPDERRSRPIGVGLAFYVENTALGPSRQMNQGGLNQGGYDIAHLRLEPDGRVTLFTGLCEMGQGFRNGLTVVCADTLGVHPDQIEVVTGDTDKCPYTGHGTGASRSAAVGGAAVRKASRTMRTRLMAIAAHMLEAHPDDLRAAGGRFWVVGSPSRSVTTADIGRAVYLRAVELPDDVDPGLEVTETFDPVGMAWPYGAHHAVVKVDTATGAVEILDYTMVHDTGVVLNPMIVEGQLHGAAAQGIGAALFEELVHDEAGQPLTTGLTDYLVPSAPEIPSFAVDHMCTPSPVVPGGVKGAGEAGVIAPPAAITNAVEDALSDYGARLTSTPLSPERIWRAINS